MAEKSSPDSGLIIKFAFLWQFYNSIMFKNLCFKLVIIFLVVLLGGCATTAGTQYRTLNFDTRIYVGNVPLDVVVFDTPEERELGLMHVKDLPQGKGALFVFEQEQAVNFWMKNTHFPVDMLFFDQQLRLAHIARSIYPCRLQHCPVIHSGRTMYVVETKSGNIRYNHVGNQLNLLILWRK